MIEIKFYELVIAAVTSLFITAAITCIEKITRYLINQNRKRYLEEQIRIFAPGLNLEIIVEYTKLCTNMGYKKNEIIEQIYHLTEKEFNK